METTTKTKQDIDEKYSRKGWGIDADPENEPASPIKNHTGDDHKRLNYNRPEQQPEDIEVLQSDERTSAGSVSGASRPPNGLSRLLRKLAFRYSESSFGHWFPLIFGDRVNIWEGFLHKRRKLPNPSRSRGLKAELKYNKKQFIAKTGVTLLVGAFVFAWLLTNERKKAKGRRKK